MGNKVVIEAELATKNFDKQIKDIEDQLKQIDYELSHTKELKLDKRTIEEYEVKAEKLTNQLASLRKKQEDLNTTNLSGATAQLNNIGNGIEGVIKKVTRWGLAVFGIRSAYNFVRGSISTLSSYNEQMATDVEYIRFALASTLQPVIERIIQLAYTLLQYIGYIAKAWFGVNIFANASAKAFNKNNKAIAGSAGSAKKLNKELQKTIAGFDEMNVLQENNNDSDTGGGGSAGGSGFKAPSIDLSNFKKFDTNIIGKWLDKLRDFILKGFDVIVKNIKKVMKDLGFSQDLIDAFSFWIGGVRKMLEGFLNFVIGILKMVVGLFTGNTELLKEGFKQTINGITTFLKGVLQMWVGAITIGVATIANLFKIMWNGVTSGAKAAFNGIKSFFSGIPSFFNGIVNKIKSMFTSIGRVAGSIIAGAFRSVVNGVLRTIENVLNSPIRTINSLIGIINKVSPTKIGKLPTFNLPRLAKGGIVNMPSRGVPIGGAIAGERGAEGVIPLTDSQQMALLGEAIGRYITVELTNVTQLDGRQIARKVEQINQNNRFVLNR